MRLIKLTEPDGDVTAFNLDKLTAITPDGSGSSVDVSDVNNMTNLTTTEVLRQITEQTAFSLGYPALTEEQYELSRELLNRFNRTNMPSEVEYLTKQVLDWAVLWLMKETQS